VDLLRRVRRYGRANGVPCIRRGNRPQARVLWESALPDHRQAQRVLEAVPERLRVALDSAMFLAA
jgi:hypothetical protein